MTENKELLNIVPEVLQSVVYHDSPPETTLLQSSLLPLRDKHQPISVQINSRSFAWADFSKLVNYLLRKTRIIYIPALCSILLVFI